MNRTRLQVSESWDGDFEFQQSYEDLNSSLQNNPPKHKRASTATVQRTAWPNASTSSLIDEDHTLVPSRRSQHRIPSSSTQSQDATLRLPSQFIPTHRITSHGSALSSSSSLNPDCSPSDTPSLEFGGHTTATETEFEEWDDLHYSSMDEGAATEVENSVRIVSGTSTSDKRRSGFRLPSLNSLFRSKDSKRVSHAASLQPPSPGMDSDLPRELRAMAPASRRPNLLQSQSSPVQSVTGYADTIKIVPLSSRAAARYEKHSKSNPSISRTPKSSAAADSSADSASFPTFLDMESTPTAVRTLRTSLTGVSRQLSFEPKDKASITINPNASRVSFASTASRRESDVDEGRSTDGSPRKHKTRKLRKSRRTDSSASRMSVEQALALAPAAAYQPLPNHPETSPSSDATAFPSPSEQGATPIRDHAGFTPPAKLRRRPLSLSLRPARTSITKQNSQSAASSASTSSQPSAGSAWRRFHRPSASVSVLPAQPILYSRPIAVSQQPETTLPNATSVASLASTIRPVQPDTTSLSLTKSVSNASLASSSSRSTNRALLLPLTAVTRPGSNEQLYGRGPSNASATICSSPARSPKDLLQPTPLEQTTSRPSSYFTISGGSVLSKSPGGTKLPPQPATLPRRVSLSDLRIPSRIYQAQARIGQDLERVREFKNGVEELKILRRSYRSIISGREGDHKANDKYTISPALSAKFALAARKIEEQYSASWECADVLVSLADGDDMEALSSPTLRRERCISMMPALASSRSLNVFDDDDMPPVPKLPATFINDQYTSSVKPSPPSKGRKLRPYSTQDTRLAADINKLPNSGNTFGLREFFTKFRRLSAAKIPTTTPNLARTNVLVDQKATLQPPTRPLSTAPSEEEDWDRSSLLSSDAATRNGLAISRARTMSILPTSRPEDALHLRHLDFSSDNMPMLLKYLGEVKSLCLACLDDLRAVTL